MLRIKQAGNAATFKYFESYITEDLNPEAEVT